MGNGHGFELRTPEVEVEGKRYVTLMERAHGYWQPIMYVDIHDEDGTLMYVDIADSRPVVHGYADAALVAMVWAHGEDVTLVL